MALPWATRSTLISKEDFRQTTLEGLNQAIEQKITDIIKSEAAALDPSQPAILAGHLTHSLATLGTERGLHLGQDYVMPISSLTDPAFDYVALGHIHKTQKVEVTPPVVYSGSMQRMDFSEEDQPKGFYAVELDPARERGSRLKSFTFVPVEARRFVTIDVKVEPGENDPTAVVLKQIEKRSADINDAIVRVKVSLPADVPSDIRENDIRRALKDARQIASISREMESRPRPRLSGLTPEGLAPMTALREYLKINNVSADRQKVLLEYAQTMIGGEPMGEVAPDEPQEEPALNGDQIHTNQARLL